MAGLPADFSLAGRIWMLMCAQAGVGSDRTHDDLRESEIRPGSSRLPARVSRL